MEQAVWTVASQLTCHHHKTWIWRRTHSCPDPSDPCHFLFYAKLTASFALPLPSLHPMLIRKLNMWIFQVNIFTFLVCEDEGVFVCLLQGGGFGESTYGQPHGPEQPLHPGGSWEQLLSLTRRSESTERASVWGPKGPGKCQFSDGCFCCWRRGGEITRIHIYSLKTSNDTLAPADGGQALESQAVTQPFSLFSDLPTC